MSAASRAFASVLLVLGPTTCALATPLLGTGESALLAGGPALGRGVSGLNSAEQCGTCHRDIHAAWKQSAHARSLEDPLVQDALDELRSEGADVGVCLRCHAPTVEITHDTKLDRKLTWEGVTCDYCHSVTRVTAGAAGSAIPRLELRPGTTKFGPIQDAVSTGHETEHRALFDESELCAPCHEYVAPSGVGVLTTYSDWKASPQAESGMTCQACHMSEVRAQVVDPKIKRVAHGVVNLHSMPGGRSIEQLNKAIRTRARVTRQGDRVEVLVDLVNRGAGHAVPTGSAARQLVLEVRMDTNRGQQAQETRVYQRVLTDADGKPLVRDRDLFARAVTLASDTRLRAGETRSERFEFQVDPLALANVKLQLLYRHTPMPDREPPFVRIFYTQSWTLPPPD